MVARELDVVGPLFELPPVAFAWSFPYHCGETPGAWVAVQGMSFLIKLLQPTPFGRGLAGLNQSTFPIQNVKLIQNYFEWTVIACFCFERKIIIMVINFLIMIIMIS